MNSLTHCLQAYTALVPRWISGIVWNPPDSAHTPQIAVFHIDMGPDSAAAAAAGLLTGHPHHPAERYSQHYPKDNPKN